MKKQILAALLAASSLCLNSSPALAYPSIFPNTGYSWVGDTMPFYDGQQFRIFYLEDLRDGDVGFHPWSLFTTKDFTDYHHDSLVIPYDNTNEFAKDSALGTGSVVQDKDGLYHAFYTGFNWRSMPKENIMHAVSRDLVSWQKLPEDSFHGSKPYIYDDTFRDPNVFYNADYDEYWMLITTRSKKARGVIARYTSKDLKHWEDKGIFFENDMGSDANMECPTLVKYGDYWYLTFSDQWPARVVHYRVAKDSQGPFMKPERDYFDASGFYAGKLAQDKENLYLVGWTPTKADQQDKCPTDWAGNLVAHQLKQREDGTLYPVPVEKVTERLQQEVVLTPLTKNGDVTTAGHDYRFGGQGFANVVMHKMEGIRKITGRFTPDSQQGKFGLMFNVGPNQTGSLNLVFDQKAQQVAFYNTDTTSINKANPELSVPVSLQSGESYDFTLLIDGTVAVLYINDQMALSTRMYGLPEHQWGIFSTGSAVTLTNLRSSTL
ncbi:putative glycosyl hydrolase family 32 (plasmid) [Selenomonas ruminantium subsp. lactilytica TAM6421]|uniref:beta-fructofuranosidase n=1 Tax=Selenomonas ruminantium subsp. lactilytica (strain NBRC 103574 / TAM6421) TaxID=927704 RepID=I0GW55_SELRL|nr:glycoside hydrolase family 32 protein [Selenomonas ruminantium]BAL84992.1 putative glycosyl hydrolase family 32 [Selenomonas ruminantium subsp. lactilytica TAM6421]